jgi:hypothetical protein
LIKTLDQSVYCCHKAVHRTRYLPFFSSTIKHSPFSSSFVNSESFIR